MIKIWFFYLKKTSIIEFWMVNEFELWTISINNYWAIIQGVSFFFFLWVICMVKIIFLTIILIIKNSITCHEKHGQYFLGRELTCLLGYVLRAFAPILQIRFFFIKIIIEFRMLKGFEWWTISINDYWAMIQGGRFFKNKK